VALRPRLWPGVPLSLDELVVTPYSAVPEASRTAAIRSRSSSGNARSRSFSSLMPHDMPAPSTDPQRSLADLCQWPTTHDFDSER